MRSFFVAISFLTRLPVERRAAFGSGEVARSAGWFPVIGILLGAVYGGLAGLLHGRLPVAVAAILLIALDALMTGALHFDGLADTADAFGGGKDRDDVLRIMRDHCIGSYGGSALVLVIGLKAAATAGLLERDHWFPALLLTPVLGRWSILLLTTALPYARETPSVIRGISKSALAWGTLALAGALFMVRDPRAWASVAFVVLVTIGFGIYCRHRIAGITGDALGANLQLAECAALLTFLWNAGA